MILNGGSLIVSGKRRLAIVFFALLAALFASALLSDLAWAQATLNVTKSDSPDPVAEGEILTYTIVVTNTDANGTASANNVVLTDDLPNTTEFVNVSTTDGTCNPEPPEGALGPIVTCQLGTLPDGESATVTIQVQPTTAAIGTQIQNQATATSTTAVGDSSPILQTTVVPDLEIQKLDDPDPVSTEDLLLYQLRVQNQGEILLTPAAGGFDIDVTAACRSTR